MSMSTQHGGGSRRPSTRPVAGAKRKPGVDDEPDTTATDADAPAAEASVADVDVSATDPEVSAADAEVDEVDEVEDADTGLDDTSAAGGSKSPSPRPSARKSGVATKAGAAKSAGTKTAGTKTVGTKSAATQPAATKTAGTKTTRPATKAGGKPTSRPAGKAGGRRMAPVRVSQGRNWGAIGLLAGVIVIAVGIVGFAGWQVYENGLTWQQRAARINGLKNFRQSDPQSLTYQKHEFGPLSYKYSPPVGGTHNPNWQRCLGDVYDAPIANEHAVHAMEHGAVWITYRPDLPKSQVEQLAKKVRGKDFLLMSPYQALDKPISLQTWGYQLKVDSAGDSRVDEFIRDLRQISQVEKGATCSTGDIITETGTTPHDLGSTQQQQPGGTGGGGTGGGGTGG